MGRTLSGWSGKVSAYERGSPEPLMRWGNPKKSGSG